MKKFRDLTRMTFGRLKVLERLVVKNRTIWKCDCLCGNRKDVSPSNLFSGNSKSCGCLFLDSVAINGRKRKTHGLSKTRIFKCWTGMMNRCKYPSSIGWENYGGRGIKVCKRWKVFINFYADMRNEYKDNLTLDRKNVNGGYNKKNCRWITKAEQNRNTTRTFSYKGESTVQASKRLGGNTTLVIERIQKMGWSKEKAFRTAVSG